MIYCCVCFAQLCFVGAFALFHVFFTNEENNVTKNINFATKP